MASLHEVLTEATCQRLLKASTSSETSEATAGKRHLRTAVVCAGAAITDADGETDEHPGPAKVRDQNRCDMLVH